MALTFVCFLRLSKWGKITLAFPPGLYWNIEYRILNYHPQNEPTFIYVPIPHDLYSFSIIYSEADIISGHMKYMNFIRSLKNMPPQIYNFFTSSLRSIYLATAKVFLHCRLSTLWD